MGGGREEERRVEDRRGREGNRTEHWEGEKERKRERKKEEKGRGILGREGREEWERRG